MPAVRSWILVDHEADHIRQPVAEGLQRRNYRLVREGRDRSRFHHPTTREDTPFASEHRLDVRVRRQTQGVARVDFRFRFPPHAPAHQVDVNEWVLRFRDDIEESLRVDLVPGVVAADCCNVEFAGPPPLFYRSQIPNPLGVRLPQEQRVVLVSSVGLLGFWVLFLVLYLLGELDIRYLACGSAIFLALPAWGFAMVVRFHTAAGYPRAAVPSLDGIVLRYRSRKRFVPWDRIVGKSSPKATSASALWEAVVSYRDDGGRIRSFQVGATLWEWIEAGRALAKSLKGPGRDAHLLWSDAPPGTPVLVLGRRLRADEAKGRRLYARYLTRGILTPLYVTEETDRAIAAKLLVEKEYSPDSLREIARTALARNYWDLGEDTYRKILEADPKDLTAACNVAGCLQRQGRGTEARSFVEGYVAAHGPSAEAHVMLSLIARDEGDEDGSRAHLGRAVELDPDNLDALHMWFDYVLGTSGLGQAVAELDLLAQAHPEAWGPPFVLAVRSADVGDSKRAMEYFETALARSLNNQTVDEYLTFLRGETEIIRAAEVADRVWASAPELDPGTWFTVAEVFRAAKIPEKARLAVSKIDLDAHPDWTERVQRLLEKL